MSDEKYPKASHKDFADAYGLLVQGRKNAAVSVVLEATKNRMELMRDYSNTGIGILGAVLTLITVAPSLIKTPVLAYMGSLVVLLTVIGCFVARRYYIADEENILIKSESEYAKDLGVVISAKLLDDVSAGLKKLDDIKTHPDYVSNTPMFFKQADKYIGAVLLVGAILVSVSLIFTVSF